MPVSARTRRIGSLQDPGTVAERCVRFARVLKAREAILQKRLRNVRHESTS